MFIDNLLLVYPVNTCLNHLSPFSLRPQESRGAIDYRLETHSYGADAPSEYEGRSSAGSLS